MIKLTNTVKHLIIINVLFYIATIALKDTAYPDMMTMHYYKNPAFKPWQIITHMFMHGSELHILFNMLGLWMFGSSIEQLIGRNKFLFLYFGAGIGAVLFYEGIDYYKFNTAYNELMQLGLDNQNIKEIFERVLPDGMGYTNKLYAEIHGVFNTKLLGASGALYGVLVAFGVLMPKAKMGLMFLPIMIEARIFIPLILLYDISFGVIRVGDGIGHFAHVGGAIFGFLIIWYMKQYHFKRRY
jgi:membrane associated rhomboid family serine protease